MILSADANGEISGLGSQFLMRHNVAAMDLDFTWKLKLRLSDQLGVSSPFDLQLLQEPIELDDTQMLHGKARQPAQEFFHQRRSSGKSD